MENNQEEEKTIDRQLAEAEERGYRRGLNEQIEQKMREPALWEGNNTVQVPDEAYTILARQRRSIWD